MIISANGDPYASFFGRGVEKDYWPDGTAECDLNDNVWRQDGGLITTRVDLPVTQLRFGDTGGGDEEGIHRLGQLKCR